MGILEASAVTLAIQKIRSGDAQIRRTEAKISALESSYRAGKSSQGNYVVRRKMLVEQLEREISLDHDALRDFYEASMREAGREPYENVDDDLSSLLSLSVAGGVR